MSFRAFLWMMLLGTLVAWGGFAYVLLMVDPFESGLPGLLLFYVTLFASCVGLFSLCGLLYRVLYLRRNEIVIREVKVAFRHAILFAFVTVASLALSAGNLFTWWNILPSLSP
jgi:hypothetical protein